MATSTASDEEAVRTAVARVPHHLDRRRWKDLEALFAETVETDYRSLFGGDVQRQPRGDLVGAWRGLLTPTVTQHVLGPIEVEVRGARAVAHCHVRAYHYKEGLPDGGEWMVAGHYVFELEKTAGDWKIAGLTLETFHQVGNRRLLEQAAT